MLLKIVIKIDDESFQCVPNLFQLANISKSLNCRDFTLLTDDTSSKHQHIASYKTCFHGRIMKRILKISRGHMNGIVFITKIMKTLNIPRFINTIHFGW